MKKGLLATTALAGASVVAIGVANAAEAPTWKLSGYMKFQFYWVDQDAGGVTSVSRVSMGTWNEPFWRVEGSDGEDGPAVKLFDVGTVDAQDHDWYFGLDDTELTLKVDGAADNGLKYGFKIEIQTNTTSTKVADEARIQFSGNWGTLQLGDEDGAEDIMNYGGENLLGAAAGWDGDLGDVLYYAGGGVSSIRSDVTGDGDADFQIETIGDDINLAAPHGPSIAGDTSDATKISYFSPRFSGFQVGASITPTPNNGDSFKEDGDWENHIGLGANYDNSFGSLHLQASAVYSMNTNVARSNDDFDDPTDLYEDVGAWSVGGIVGWGPFSVGANYTDNGESGQVKVWDDENGNYASSGIETSYWNVAARFKTGPMAFAAGYFASVKEFGQGGMLGDSTFDAISLTADYTAAPGLVFYGEINLTSEEMLGGAGASHDFGVYSDELLAEDGLSLNNDATILILGTKVSF